MVVLIEWRIYLPVDDIEPMKMLQCTKQFSSVEATSILIELSLPL